MKRIKIIEIIETFKKINKEVYWLYKFPGDKEWNFRLTPYKEIPWVKNKKVANSPKKGK